MDAVERWLQFIRELLESKVFGIALGRLLYLLVLIAALIYVSGKLKKWLMRRLTRSKVNPATRQVTATLVRYFVIGVGLLIIIQATGIDLTTLNVLAGAVG